MESKAEKGEVDRVVAACGLEEVRGKMVSALSKGYRQRLGLSQALLNQPPLLILDEPTIGLDPSQIVEIRELIKNLEGAHTVMLSSHILPEVSQLCHRVIIINRGQIVASDTPENLSRQLGHGSRVLMTVSGPVDQVEAALQAVAGVTRVLSRGEEKYLVEAGHGQELRSELARAVVGGGVATPGIEGSGIHPGRSVPQFGNGRRVMIQIRGWLAVVRKELTVYFGTPIFYITGFFFLLLAGYFFYTNVIYYSIVSLQAVQQAGNPQVAAQLNPLQMVFRPLFAVLGLVLLFLVPFITMRLLAEEKRSGTAELLFTYPLTDWAVIAGKFGAALLIYLILLGFTVSYSLVFSLVTRLDWGALGTGYLGLVLLGGACLSLGLFASSLTENQIVAGVVAFALLLFFWIIGWVQELGAGDLGRSSSTCPFWTTSKTSPEGSLIPVTWCTA